MAKAAAIRTKAPVRRARSSANIEAEYTTSREDIARRAFELYLARGASEGDALSDWYRAERELTAMR
jgi:hypothetical protein